MDWRPVRDKDKYGVAVHNFCNDGEYNLKLKVGNTVHIFEEYNDWYYGFSHPNREICGVFPKSYIHIKDCIVDRTGKLEMVTPRMPPIVQELTAALKEWGSLLQKLYAINDSSFKEVYDTLFSLIDDRKKMLSGQLPADEMKQLKQQVTLNIDLVNSLLGLDLVVRDDQGNILNPDITSSVKLFKHHQQAIDSLIKKFESKRRSDISYHNGYQPYSSFSLMITINNIILKVPDPCQISLGLYMLESHEGKEGREMREKPLTEPYIFIWTPGGYTDNQDLFSSLKCLFTDLSNKIISQKPLYLLVTVVREGSMTKKEIDKRSSTTPSKKALTSHSIRRPHGVFIVDISNELKKLRDECLSNDILSAPSLETFAPFYHCREKDTLESTFRKAVISSNELSKEKSSEYTFWFRISLLNGNMKQLQQDNPHQTSCLRETAISYPLLLSDFISPDDIRNDLYVTLLGGEFARERNVEVTVRVVNEDGQFIPGVLYVGSGNPAQNEYRSVTYHHEEKPRWMETFKVALPIEEFRKAHLKFIFKHRSTNEVKDKSERPFALSFVNLMQPNGTTLLNCDHELIVYKIDSKKYNEDDPVYLRFPYVRTNGEELQKFREDAFSLSSKDKFFISTVFCSTKLTQNAELLSLLEWGASGSNCKEDLEHHLMSLKNVPSAEINIFLQDTLDVLFEILMNSSKDVDSDKLVFDALIDIIYMAVEQNKHESHISALETYIEQNFHATLVFEKLLSVFKTSIDEVCTPNIHTPQTGSLNKAMKCFYYIMKFIIQSRKLYHGLNQQGNENFQKSIQSFFSSIVNLMSQTKVELMPVQGLCLKYIATTIPDVMTEFNHSNLSLFLIDIVLKENRLSQQRLIAMNEICHSPLFTDLHCRSILLKSFVAYIKKLLAENEEVTDIEVVLRKEKVKGKLMQILGTESALDESVIEDKNRKELKQIQLCIKNLSDMLDILYSSVVGSTVEDIRHLVEELLQDLLSIISKMSDDDELLPHFTAVLISLLRQVSNQAFLDFTDKLEDSDLLNFEINLISVLQKLIEKPVFPSDWCEMVMLQNSIFMKVFRLSKQILTERLKNPFIDAVWMQYFQCAVLFIIQPSLQLERFAPNKCSKILNRYKDLRIEAALTITELWRSLGNYQHRFIVRRSSGNSLIGPFLKMTMLPVVEIRRCTIPIFYEMMLCEFNSLKDKGRNIGVPKEKFIVFENEMLEQLDILVEQGRGDEHYKDLFVLILSSKCKEKSVFTKQVLEFVMTVGKLMEKLLQYRNIRLSSENSPDIHMSCTASLLDFYASINRKKLYLRYVYKLVNLHYQSNNFTEAAYTLKNHADLLTWKHEFIPEALRSLEDSHIKHHDELKEKLYDKIIANFCNGKMWEAAIKLSKELIQRHEDVTLNYSKVASLLSEMAKFYKNIMNDEASGPKPSYFRVAYYGRGFPAFLQNKVFVYRGNDYERIADFQYRILDQFPNAELMKNLSPPSRNVMESPEQYIQINSIECVVKETQFIHRHIAECIQQYYKFNHINTFTYYRPFHQGQRDPDNEFATLCTEQTTLKTNYELPGLLKCFPVISEEKTTLSPLQNAIRGMQLANDDLEKLIRQYTSNSAPFALDNLTRKLTGIVDAAVMGGTKNYEKAFLIPEYEIEHPEDHEDIIKLKALLSDQIPLLELALDVHAYLVDEKLVDLHTHLINSFKGMKALFQKNYGVSAKPAELEEEVKHLKRVKRLSSHDLSSSRSSHYSLNAEPLTHSPSRMSVASNKLPNSTMPRSKKLSSASSVGYKKDKKDKSLRSLLRRDSLCNQPKSATSWFARPDSGIYVQESFLQSNDSKNVNINIEEACITEVSPIQHSPPLNLKQSSLICPSNNYFSESNEFPEDSEAAIVDVPPPLPMKNRNLEIDKINDVNDCLSCGNSSLAPEKPPRPTYQTLNFEHQNPS